MTDFEIVNRIMEIRVAFASSDYKQAHVLEDDLYRDFIRYIANPQNYLGRKAKSVLLTKNMKFNRTCV